MMRRLIFVCAFTLLCICGCGRQNADANNAITEPDYVYEADSVKAFCVDDNRNVYIYCEDENKVFTYDKEENLINTLALQGKNYDGITLCGNKLYMYSLDNVASLVEISLSTSEEKAVFEHPKMYQLLNMVSAGNKVYILTQELGYTMEELMSKSEPESGYHFWGEKLICYDTESKVMTDTDLEGVISICNKDEDSVLVYIFDRELGKFCFKTIKAGIIQPDVLLYSDNNTDNYFRTFSYDDILEKMIVNDYVKGALVSYDSKNTEKQSSFYNINSLEPYTRVECKDGYTYYISDGKLCRIFNSNYIKEYTTLTVYNSGYEYKLPEGTGFEIITKNVDDEILAMSMMAGDSDYDLVLLSTESPMAEQLRRVGAYEPLNKVKGMDEYLNSRFEYIGEAAKNYNGAYWMVPCYVSCDVLVYNEKLCAQNGLDTKNITNEGLNELSWNISNLSNGKQPLYWEYNLVRDKDRLINLYLRDYVVTDNAKFSFESEIFIKYAKLLKSEYGRGRTGENKYYGIKPYNYISEYGKTEEELQEEYLEYYSKVAFGEFDRNGLEKYFLESNALSYGVDLGRLFEISAMPSLESGNNKSLAKAYIVVVNPASQNKEAAMAYVENLVKILNVENIYTSKVLKSEYDSMKIKTHEIYENAQIDFNYPKDIVQDDMVKYLNGEQTLESTIAEIQRKLDIYLKE